MNFCARSRFCIAVATSLLGIAGLSSMLAAQSLSAQSATDNAEAQARQAWRETMHHVSTYDTGCFHASYPSTQWEKVECGPVPAYRSALPKLIDHEQTETVAGNWYDYVAQAPAGQSHLARRSRRKFSPAPVEPVFGLEGRLRSARAVVFRHLSHAGDGDARVE